MKKSNRTLVRKHVLGQVSRSTLGGVRGTIEVGGLYTAGIALS